MTVLLAMRPRPQTQDAVDDSYRAGRWLPSTIAGRALLIASTFIVLLAIAGSIWRARETEAPATILGACGHSHVTLVDARLHQIAQTCTVLRDVVAYFSRMQLAFEPKVTIQFVVSLPESHGGWGRSHASYNTPSSMIRLKADAGVVAWGIASPDALARSFLTHEFVHLAMHLVLAERLSIVPHHWQEFFAYAVQFDLMSPPLLVAILRAYADVKAFESLWHVNEATRARDPERFAVAAYKMYVSKGRTTFLKQALELDIQLP